MSQSARLSDLSSRLVELRRAVHRHPEVGLHLPNTQRLIVETLERLPLEVTLGKGLSSVTAVLRGTRPGPTVLLRADMDALPVTEAAKSDIRSEVDSVMHACGHDLHVAMLVGGAHLLAAHREELAGDVVFMFQPGEENDDGAGMMIEEGVLEASGTRPLAAYALHVTSSRFDNGVFASRGGPIMASSDNLAVTIQGAGGHASAPHLALDPIPVACEVVLAIQTLVTRSLDVFDPALITVGTINAGTRSNVIPDTAAFEATIRSFSETTRTKLYESLPRLVSNIARAHGLSAKVDITPGYPVMRNHESETDFLADTVRGLFGEEGYVAMPEPLISSEDFSRVLRAVPGAFAMLGACPPGENPATAPYNHSPEATFDESILMRGAELFCALAVSRLALAESATTTEAG